MHLKPETLKNGDLWGQNMTNIIFCSLNVCLEQILSKKKVEIPILSFLNVNMEFQCIQIHKEIANCRSVGVLDNIKVLSAWKLQRPSSTMNILR